MNRLRRQLQRQLLAGPYLIWLTGFILLPLVVIIFHAFTNAQGNFTLNNVLEIAAPVHRKALFLSLWLAFLCTFICLALSYPLAMILNNLKIKNQSFLVFIFILPMWMNFMLRILAWKILLDKHGVINSFLSMLGLPNMNIIYTPTAVVFCMVYDFLPFMILPIYNSMSRIETNVVEAAEDLGAGKLTVFFKIILPLTLSGVISGIIMVFVPALTTFAIPDILGGGKVLLIGNVIEQAFMFENNWGVGSGLSFVLMVFVILTMAIMNNYNKEGKGTGAW